MNDARALRTCRVNVYRSWGGVVAVAVAAAAAATTLHLGDGRVVDIDPL